MIIKYKLNGGCPPIINETGDWFDLAAAEDFTPSEYPSSRLVSLGIAMKLPKGFEAIVLPRSSLFKKTGCILANSQGVIDNSYCGDVDIWKFNAIALNKPNHRGLLGFRVGDRICQFRIQPSQRAGVWIKLKWLFVREIKFKEVKSLDSMSRGGFGSTGGYK